jgi:hypothetical protein
MSEQPSIFGRMAAVLADVGAIEKTRKNQAQGFQFRGIDDAMNELHGTFAKHSLFLTHEILEHSMTERETRNGGKSFHHIAKVRFTFWAPDGSNVQATGVGEAADSGDKGAGKAMAYALKVCLLQTFLIPTEEEKDPDYRVTEWGKEQAKPVAKAPVTASAVKKEADIPAGLLTDKKLPDEPPQGTKQFAAGDYVDNDESKRWLQRELEFYGIGKRLANFTLLAGEVHKHCIGMTRQDAQKSIENWAKSKGFVRAEK